MRIVIDPGHGGTDPGAIGHGIHEADINLAIAKTLKFVLGNQALLTRADDIYLSLNERSDFSNQAKADLFISIHCNSAENPQAHGSETFTYNPNRLGEASILNKAIVKNLGTLDRGPKIASYSVLRKTNCPAYLIELGFISNKEDNKKLKNLLENREARLSLANQLASEIKALFL